MFMTRVFWLIRGTVFAVIGLLALISPPASAVQQAAQIACFAAVGVGLALWIFAEAFARYRARCLPFALCLMAVAGGVAATTNGSGQSLIIFSCIAASWAASDAGLLGGIVVAAAGIVPVWVAGALAGSSFGTIAGEPLLIVVCLMIGLNRRSYRVRAEQAAALLSQQQRLQAERELVQAEQRRADVLDERARIAREIHDVLAHSLGALGIQIQAAKALLTDHGDTGRAVEALTTAQRMAADGLTETRRAVHALRVDMLPLGEELAAVAATHRQRHHVPVSVSTSGAARSLPPDSALALLRTAQEAMVNAAKHAPGQPVAVRLEYGADNVRLSVVNELDGAGSLAGAGGSGVAAVSGDSGDSAGSSDFGDFGDSGVSGREGAAAAEGAGAPDGAADTDGAAAAEGAAVTDGAPVQRPGSGGGYGLTGMRERLALLNGTLAAGPRDNEWAVTAELPLAADDRTAR